MAVRDSLMPNGGLGVFATAARAFDPACSMLVEYRGKEMTEQEFLESGGDVSRAITHRVTKLIIDARGDAYYDCLTRYFNHDAARPHVEFRDDTRGRVFAHQLRPFVAGEELFADYGKHAEEIIRGGGGGGGGDENKRARHADEQAQRQLDVAAARATFLRDHAPAPRMWLGTSKMDLRTKLFCERVLFISGTMLEVKFTQGQWLDAVVIDFDKNAENFRVILPADGEYPDNRGWETGAEGGTGAKGHFHVDTLPSSGAFIYRRRPGPPQSPKWTVEQLGDAQ